jgi:fucose 4-O-acetylase-like acetyltransferase
LAENCLFIFIGRYGLEIYLLHTFIVTACRTLFYELNISNEAVIILASSTAGIVIPIIIAALSKKLRLYNFLFSPYKRSLHSARH